MYNSFAPPVVPDETRESWYVAAAAGARFLNKAMREDGTLWFSTSESGGEGLHFQRRPFTAVFYILGSLEFYQILRTRKAEGKDAQDDPSAYAEQALLMFAKFRAWIDDATLVGRPPPPKGSDAYSNLGEVMCLAALSEEFIAKFPERTDEFMPFVADAMRRVAVHYDTERRVFMEWAHRDRGIEHTSMRGRLVNPGHSIEVGWFTLHLCKLNPGAPEAAPCRKMALDAIVGSLALGWDSQFGGGILYMMDVLGMPLADCTVTATNKLWWPHAEALYACTLAYTETQDPRFLAWLELIHDYVYAHFVDSEARGGLGEWFGYLDRQGQVFNRCKGGNYKGCYHVPRALLFSSVAAAAFLKRD